MVLDKIGDHIIHFDRLPSTNAYAAELLSKSKPVEGTVITTDSQYAGRGQMNNTWESEPMKNVSLSVVLYPSFLKVKEQFYLNQAISLAVYDTITAYVPNEEVYIKWPNDIYIGPKKVAGILIQNQIKGDTLSSSIIGLGINVNQKHFFSDAPNPCALVHYLVKEVPLDEFRQTLFKKISKRYAALRLRTFHVLTQQYETVLYRNGQSSWFEINGKRVRGEITGVNEIGQLVVSIDGQLHNFGFKEIAFCKEN